MINLEQVFVVEHLIRLEIAVGYRDIGNVLFYLHTVCFFVLEINSGHLF